MRLSGKRVAVLVEADYQDLEVHYPRLRLLEEGADVWIVGTGSATLYKGKYGYPVEIDRSVQEVKGEELDGIVIPGGWAPDKLRMSEEVLELVREMMRRGKVIACICHGGWVLASADVVRGKRVTSYRAIRDDLIHAGAQWMDAEVVVDGNLITSRKPEDLPAFMRETIRALER